VFFSLAATAAVETESRAWSSSVELDLSFRLVASLNASRAFKSSSRVDEDISCPIVPLLVTCFIIPKMNPASSPSTFMYAGSMLISTASRRVKCPNPPCVLSDRLHDIETASRARLDL